MKMRAAIGDQGALYACCDDAYTIAEPDKMADVLAHVPAIYGRGGLKLGYGHGKTEIILPQGYDREDFPYTPRRPLRPSPSCRFRIQVVSWRPPSPHKRPGRHHGRSL